MNYCMSDIHGDYDKYIKMLETINFLDEDNLYVIGDVIDRGEHGMKILKDMMMRPNVFPILGNHEYMARICMDFLMQEITEESVAELNNAAPELMQGLVEWMNVGGQISIAEFRNMSQEDREDIREYLEEFSLYDIVEANGKVFVLVHAGLDNFSSDRDLDDYDFSEVLFHTPDYDRQYFKNAYLVTGHVPTRVAYAKEQGLLLEELPPGKWRDEVYEKNHHIAIDCGCSYDGRLGCICLETGEKFY